MSAGGSGPLVAVSGTEVPVVAWFASLAAEHPTAAIPRTAGNAGHTASRRLHRLPSTAPESRWSVGVSLFGSPLAESPLPDVSAVEPCRGAGYHPEGNRGRGGSMEYEGEWITTRGCDGADHHNEAIAGRAPAIPNPVLQLLSGRRGTQGTRLETPNTSEGRAS